MKYILLFIQLLASPVAVCQDRYQPPKAVDTSGQHRPVHHIYTFDGIVRKPWTFYRINDGEFKPLPNKEQVSNKTKQWDKFIMTLRDITVDCVGDSANITILYNKGKFRYMLKRSAPNKYTYSNEAVNLMLITKSSLICEFYFIKGNAAASISNMDWDIQ